jgi:hypothetical protein
VAVTGVAAARTVVGWVEVGGGCEGDEKVDGDLGREIVFDTVLRMGRGQRVGIPIGTRGPAAVGGVGRVEMRRDPSGNPVDHRAWLEDMESIRHGNALAGLRRPIEDK